ncbi:MAG: hypothetical protein J2P25_22480 [Nocardiopsaceae bacterium]|nr:hypothetical protein [Nocardiopsaceae bacterium]
MPFLIALIAAAVVALIILGFVAHLLFSPWLLLAAVAVLAWFKFRPRRSHR